MRAGRLILSVKACLIATLLASPTSAATPASEALTAEQILAHTTRVYATCSSYQDSGVVRTVDVEPDFLDRVFHSGRRVEKTFFYTAFVRPNRFRFESRERRRRRDVFRDVVWWNGEQIRSQRDRYGTTEIEREESISSALPRGAETVPEQLLPNDEVMGWPSAETPVPAETMGWWLANSRHPKRIADAPLGSATCFRIRGGDDDSPMTLWIDKSTFLLLRIDERRDQFADSFTEETTTYHPRINEPIAPGFLTFASPETGRVQWLQWLRQAIAMRLIAAVVIGLYVGVIGAAVLLQARGRRSTADKLSRRVAPLGIVVVVVALQFVVSPAGPVWLPFLVGGAVVALLMAAALKVARRPSPPAEEASASRPRRALAIGFEVLLWVGALVLVVIDLASY